MKIKKILIVLMILGVGLSAVPAASQDRGSFYVGGSFSLYDATIIDQFTRYRRGNIITGNLFCFVNFSVERGRFQFSKEGTSTAYDVDIPVMGYGFGMVLVTMFFPVSLSG